MDSFHLTSNMSRITVKFQIDPAEAYATGLACAPILGLKMAIDANYPLESPDGAFVLGDFRCKIAPFDHAPIAMSQPKRIDAFLTAQRREVKDEHLHIEVPLDRERIAFMERESKGKDIRLRVDVELDAQEFVGFTVTRNGSPKTAWGFVRNHVMRGQFKTSIPRSVWIERILPNSGFGRIHILELPAIPIEQCAGMKKSFDALTEALELQRKGFGDEAVGKCRLALEPFFKSLEIEGKDGFKKRVPVLEPSWETKLVKATYEWLNECFVGVKKPTNQPHHRTGTLFDEMEIQLLITVTTALIAYAVNTASASPSVPATS